MTHISTLVPTFNLWHEPWITIEYADGTLDEVSIKTALTTAHQYRVIYEPSPLITVGIHRLLTAILQDMFDPQSTHDLALLWRSGEFSSEKIQDFDECYQHRFDIFDAEAPFMQSGDLPLQPPPKSKTKTVSYLIEEEPALTAVTHYHHRYDSQQLLCTKCVAKGLTLFPAFASSGGAGIKPSINGVPPLYMIPGGQNYFQSLSASLVSPNYQPSVAQAGNDQVWWHREPIVHAKREIQNVGYLHSLTFPARRVRLHPIRTERHCTRCNSQTAWGVQTMHYEMGESRPKDSAFWRDPFVAYRPPKDNAPPLPIRPVEGRATWREFAGLFLPTKSQSGSGGHLRPALLDQLQALEDELPFDEDTPLPFRTISLRTDMKMKIFEWQEDGFIVPPNVLGDFDIALLIEDSLRFVSDCEKILKDVFRKHFKGKTSKQERHAQVKQKMVQAYWQGLAQPFRGFVLSFDQQQASDPVFHIWLDQIQRHALDTFTQSADSVGNDAVTLRQRVEGIAHCRASLIAKRKKQFPKEESLS